MVNSNSLFQKPSVFCKLAKISANHWLVKLFVFGYVIQKKKSITAASERMLKCSHARTCNNVKNILILFGALAETRSFPFLANSYLFLADSMYYLTTIKADQYIASYDIQFFSYLVHIWPILSSLNQK